MTMEQFQTVTFSEEDSRLTDSYPLDSVTSPLKAGDNLPLAPVDPFAAVADNLRSHERD